MRLSLKFAVVLGMVLFITMVTLSNDAYASDLANASGDVSIPQGDLSNIESSLDSMGDQIDYIRDDIGDTFEQVNINYDATESYLQDITNKVDKVSYDLEGAVNSINDTNQSLIGISSSLESLRNGETATNTEDEILNEVIQIKNMLQYVQTHPENESSGIGSTSDNLSGESVENPHTIDDIYNVIEFTIQSVWMLLGFISALIVGKVFLI